MSTSISFKWHSCLEEMVSANPKAWKMCFATLHADFRSIYGWIQSTSSPEFTGTQVHFVMTPSHWCMCEFLDFKDYKTCLDGQNIEKEQQQGCSAQASPRRSLNLAMAIIHFLLNMAPCCYSTCSYFKNWSFLQVPGNAIREQSRTIERY